MKKLIGIGTVFSGVAALLSGVVERILNFFVLDQVGWEGPFYWVWELALTSFTLWICLAAIFAGMGFLVKDEGG